MPPVVIDAPVATRAVRQDHHQQARVQGHQRRASRARPASCYRFEVSQVRGLQPDRRGRDRAVPNGSGTTTMTLGELPYNTTYYWRVRGTRRHEGIGRTRTRMSFTTPDPPAPPAAGRRRRRSRRRADGRRRTQRPAGGAAAELRRQRRAGRGARESRARCRTRVRTRRHLAVHGPGRRHAAHLRHALGLQRQARQRERSVEGRRSPTTTAPGPDAGLDARSTSSTSSAATAARRRRRPGTT